MAEKGNVTRRGFLKLLGGLASLPMAKQLGLDKLLLSEAASAPTAKPFTACPTPFGLSFISNTPYVSWSVVRRSSHRGVAQSCPGGIA